MNQERHIVRQARMKSCGFKIDHKGRIIIVNTNNRKKIFPLQQTTLKYFECKHCTRSVAQILNNRIVLGSSGIRIVPQMLKDSLKECEVQLQVFQYAKESLVDQVPFLGWVVMNHTPSHGSQLS